MTLHIATVLGAMRLPFLMLTPACIFLGVALAIQKQGSVDPVLVALVMIGAMAAHISVNTFNEYQDYHSGLDEKATRTPFSGGSGSLPANPHGSRAVLMAAVTSLLITIGIGIYFLLIKGTALLPLGLLGVVIILTYTRWINRSAILCLLTPGLAFGPLMITGTVYVLTGEITGEMPGQIPGELTADTTGDTLIVSLVPFFLVNNLLLLNQFPDRQADASVGRNHLPIRYGIPASIIVYLLFVFLAANVIFYAIAVGILPLYAYLAFIPLTPGFFAGIGAWRFHNRPDRLIPYLAINVATAVLTPIALALVITAQAMH